MLYLHYELVEEPEFGPPEEIRIAEAWPWIGEPWGGLADGTSIADRVVDEPPD
ncbi:hypothetical protein CKA32_002390 [Geitlerinema sp. FC II]|nr:hypothetical protein CKA32_002390 [Geitlerinema sp. FC II]